MSNTPFFRLRSIRACVFVLLLFSSGILFSQERETLNGQLFADSIAEAQVNIINLTAKTGTVNDPNGNFKIDVKKGDTVLLSSLLYRPYRLQITDSILQTQPLRIYLTKAVNVLDEVKINTTGLTGDLTTDANSVPVFDQAGVGFPLKGKKLTVAQRRLYTASSSVGGTPLDPLINMLTGRMAMLKRQREYEKIETKKSKLIAVMSMGFFTKTLKIPKTRVEDFVYYCIQAKSLAEIPVLSKKLELVKFLSEKAKAYKILNNIK